MAQGGDSWPLGAGGARDWRARGRLCISGTSGRPSGRPRRSSTLAAPSRARPTASSCHAPPAEAARSRRRGPGEQTTLGYWLEGLVARAALEVHVSSHPYPRGPSWLCRQDVLMASMTYLFHSATCAPNWPNWNSWTMGLASLSRLAAGRLNLCYKCCAQGIL